HRRRGRRQRDIISRRIHPITHQVNHHPGYRYVETANAAPRPSTCPRDRCITGAGMKKKSGGGEGGVRMWLKEARQRSFEEQSIVGGNGRNARLERIAALIDWRAL